MATRKKSFLYRSRDHLLANFKNQPAEDEEDAWYQKDKLYKDHILEVLEKWTKIDDEIWAKVVVLEKNRRVAKAYARAPVLTVNGSSNDFDGFRIGLCGFENPMRDPKTDELKRHIGHGIKIKIDTAGNILVKRLSRFNVFVKNIGQGDENTVGSEVLNLPGCALEPEKPFKLFDMKKFQSNINRELRKGYPDRRRLEQQCLSAIAFVKSEPELLECPIWILIINLVAMDMLKSKIPPVQRVMDIKNRPRIPIPEEDPYSVAGTGSSSSAQFLIRRSDKPPKLPPRENFYPHNIPKPDYDDAEEDTRLIPFSPSREKSFKANTKDDDPYYCGLLARVPKFISKAKRIDQAPTKKLSVSHQPPQFPPPLPPMPHMHQQSLIRPRRFVSGGAVPEVPYNQLNNRFPGPTNRSFTQKQPAISFIGAWD